MKEDFSLKENYEKPKELYVGSKTRGISELEPRQENVRDSREGPVVFAARDKALASIFLIDGHDDDWTSIGYFNDVPYVVIAKDRDAFVANDRGGSLYTVSSAPFNTDVHKGMGDKEWTSSVSVQPLSEERIDSTLDAMLANGVQVYFMEDKVFHEFVSRLDESPLEAIKLLSESVSENQRHNNHVVFDKEWFRSLETEE